MSGAENIEPISDHEGPLAYAWLFDQLRSRAVVSSGGCWEWTMARNRQGYGQTRFGGKKTPAHRAMAIAFKGVLPVDVLVCHQCDNPCCINPGHLFLGSQADNARDRESKGRGTKLFAAQNPAFKGSPELVSKMVAAFNAGQQIKEIAASFGMSHVTVRKWLHAHGCDTFPKGERKCNAKLNQEKVAEIRRRLAAGESKSSIARAFGVSFQPIYLIAKGEAWK